MTTTPVTAASVVAEYLASKGSRQGGRQPSPHRDAVQERTRAIIAELPDGFTARDVRACVEALGASDTAMLEATKKSTRARWSTLVLNEMVADGSLKLEGTLYARGSGAPAPYPTGAVGV